MIFYFIHYFLSFLISSLAAFRKETEKWVFPVVFLLLFLFAAFRGQYVGRDYLIYMDYFQKLTSEKNTYFTLNKVSIYEPSFYFIPYISRALVGSAYYMQLSFTIFAFLGVYFKLKSFRIYSNSFFLSVILYLTNFYLLHEMTEIRVGVASGIFLLGVKEIYNKNFLKYLFFILTACFFHYSAIMYLPLYFLDSRTIRKGRYLTLIAICSLASLCHLNLLGLSFLSSLAPKIELYMKMAEKGIAAQINIWNNPGFLINLFFTVLLIVKADIIEQKNKYSNVLLKINVFSIVLYLILASIPILAIRFSQAFGVVQMVLFPCSIFVFDKKSIAYILITIVSFIFFYNYYYRIPLFAGYYTWW